MTQNTYKSDPEDPDENGLVFFTWSEKVTENIVGYSLITFYTIIVLGIGQFLRSALQTNSNNIFIKDMPRPDSLLLICEGILISRMEKNLENDHRLIFERKAKTRINLFIHFQL